MAFVLRHKHGNEHTRQRERSFPMPYTLGGISVFFLPNRSKQKKDIDFTFCPNHNQCKSKFSVLGSCGAANGARTRDPQLGKLMLYRLSYCRMLLSTVHGNLRLTLYPVSVQNYNKFFICENRRRFFNHFSEINPYHNLEATSSNKA